MEGAARALLLPLQWQVKDVQVGAWGWLVLGWQRLWRSAACARAPACNVSENAVDVPMFCTLVVDATYSLMTRL